MKDPHPYIKVFPCEEDVGFWRILLQAPEETPYEGGTFLLYIHFGESYPMSAPEMRFVTPIHHCNINSNGKICHSIFNRNYS
jgi:ubiquitin-protein ligase